LLLDYAGRLCLRQRYVEDLAAIVAAMDPEEWRNLSGQAVAAMWTADLARDQECQKGLADKMEARKPTLNASRAEGWERLVEVLRAGQ
jgi:hypothetical protein